MSFNHHLQRWWCCNQLRLPRWPKLVFLSVPPVLGVCVCVCVCVCVWVCGCVWVCVCVGSGAWLDISMTVVCFQQKFWKVPNDHSYSRGYWRCIQSPGLQDVRAQAMGFAVRVRSAGQKYGPTCHQRDRADVTQFVTLVRLSSLGQHVGVLALAGYKRRKPLWRRALLRRGHFEWATHSTPTRRCKVDLPSSGFLRIESNWRRCIYQPLNCAVII